MTQTEPIYEIYEVAALTGLAPARLRAWERRYAVVRPARQANRYRAYNARQVALLRAYARLIQAGSRIGDLVSQPIESVLAQADARDQDGTPVGAFLAAVERLDRGAMYRILETEARSHGLVHLCDQVIQPLGQVVGDRWALGLLPIALEHLASETVVSFLKHALTMVVAADQPVLLANCLAGERHEWGVLRSLAHAQAAGWRLNYLGPDLPLGETIEAAWRLKPSLVALSASDPHLVQRQLRELLQLPKRLPAGVAVMFGGRGFVPHAEPLKSIGLLHGSDQFPTPAALRAR
ncbi:MAG: MerR family transcriptional regulator [Gemmatimonadota bacterium]